MPLRRVGRPGLLGTMARTAVIAGTASATAGAVNRHQQGKAEQQAEQQQYEAQQQAQQQQLYAQQAAAAQAAQAAPAAPAAGGGNDLLAQIEQLGQLHASGVLSDAEFAAAKAKLLG
ncbi:SHOCT domain-containing protein [Oerskovia jenensis]|uniref:Type II secretory pathway pseudopilin PulG n=2 Tax=Oerskovia jenensis TaxID=162169 RepID=A0ABS2LGH8_9CELL|nr:SHOCT domain-containing protein [Oerskovia jenensis]MBM7479487.1 type II secretory pathway pseudopilin PulG [Oerskovia jenensis]